MRLTRSLWVKLLVTTVATGGFISLYEVTMRDWREPDAKLPPGPGDRISISTTAYCKGSVTAAGVAVQSGAAAADRSLLPLGSIVQIETDDPRYDGMYTILDTGPEIRGRDVDIYMWSCNEALTFGRREARMKVLRLGWDPRATVSPTPRLIDRLLRRPSRGQSSKSSSPPPLPSQPLSLPQLEVPQPEDRRTDTPQAATPQAETPPATAPQAPTR